MSAELWELFHRVRATFDMSLADAILLIYLSPRRPADHAWWLFTKRGDYIVRSGYHMVCIGWETSSSVSMESKSIWGVIWALKVHPHVQNFMWKFAHNILPIKSSLVCGHCCVNAMCGICPGAKENACHIFIGCLWVKGVWEVLAFQDMCEVQGWDTSDWFVMLSLCWERRVEHCVLMRFGVYGGLRMIGYLTTAVWNRILWLRGQDRVVVNTLK